MVVPQAAVDFLRGKRLEPAFDYRDVWHQEHAHAFTVAKLVQADLLADVHAELVEHLEAGETFKSFERRIRPALQKHGWWGEAEVEDPVTGEKHVANVGPARLRTIYDTNMRLARAKGQWDRIERVKDSRPFLLYGLGPSRVHRDQHVEWDGLILPVDHPFWRVALPPNGYGCRCHVRQITAREAEARGGQSPDPDMRRIAMKNPRTGRVVRTISGVHPSFAYNPGKVRR